MADAKILMPFILSKEGGYSNKKSDKGGPTMKGVTLVTYRSVYGEKKTVADLKKITNDEWYNIYKKHYWDKCKADEIKDQSVANLLVDFAWHSGVGRASKAIQKVVGARQDGIIGDLTLREINDEDARELFTALKLERVKYLQGIAKGSQKVNLKGWLNRVGDIHYGSLKYDYKTVTF